MTLDKIDLIEAREAFLALWMARYGQQYPEELEGDYQYFLGHLVRDTPCFPDTVLGAMRNAILESREWHRQKANSCPFP